MIEVKSVDVWYGNIRALKDVSISVDKGEIVAIIGSNGAGKSTLIKAVSGLVDKKSGEVFFEGQAITRKPAEMISRQGIAVVPENRRLFNSMSVLENLQLGAYMRIRQQRPAGGQRRPGLYFPSFPAPGGEKKAGGRDPLRRGAADARYRPGAHGKAEGNPDGRAVDRLGAPGCP